MTYGLYLRMSVRIQQKRTITGCRMELESLNILSLHGIVFLDAGFAVQPGSLAGVQYQHVRHVHRAVGSQLQLRGRQPRRQGGDSLLTQHQGDDVRRRHDQGCCPLRLRYIDRLRLT